jgi:hypothetical protein
MEGVKCPVCSERLAEVGVLCEECRDELSSPIRISPEQIQHRSQRPTPAALIDIWGRVHQLDARTLVGRQLDSLGLAVLEPTMSRHHAHLTLDGETWTLRDLGSANGTFHDDQPVQSSVAVHDGDRIRFGQVAFYMIEDVGRLPPPRTSRTFTTTIKPPTNQSARRARPPATISMGTSVPTWGCRRCASGSASRRVAAAD